MEEDLRALLVADAGVTAVVGTRVSWGDRPQGSLLPSIVLYAVGGPKSYHLGGEAGPLQPRVQVNCLGESYLSVLGATRAVVAALSGFSGTVGSTYFQGILQDSEPVYLRENEGDIHERIFGLTTDFIVNHTPITP